MDYSKGKDYCAALKSGISEHDIARNEQLTLPELYRVVEFTDIDVARQHLEHFCDGYINYMCLAWPGYDEKLCPVGGYEKECPLKSKE